MKLSEKDRGLEREESSRVSGWGDKPGAKRGVKGVPQTLFWSGCSLREKGAQVPVLVGLKFLGEDRGLERKGSSRVVRSGKENGGQSRG